MKKNNTHIFICLFCIAPFVFFKGVQAGHIDDPVSCPKSIPSQIKMVMDIVDSSYTYREDKGEKIRLCIGDKINESVKFAFDNANCSDNRDIRRACRAIIPAFENESYIYLLSLTNDKKILDRKTLSILTTWASAIKDIEHLDFYIKHTINNKEIKYAIIKTEDGEWVTFSKQRICDSTLTAMERKIDGGRSLFNVDLKNRAIDSYEVIDERISLFKAWWAQNKDKLKWSEEKECFVVVDLPTDAVRQNGK